MCDTRKCDIILVVDKVPKYIIEEQNANKHIILSFKFILNKNSKRGECISYIVETNLENVNETNKCFISKWILKKASSQIATADVSLSI